MMQNRLMQWLLLLALAWAQQLATAATLTVGVLGLEDDARYQPRRLEHNYPAQPGGRALEGAAVAVEESAPELDAVGHKLVLRSFLAANSADLPRVVAQMNAAKLQYVLLDLPDSEMKSALASTSAALGSALIFNIGSGLDALRGTACMKSMWTEVSGPMGMAL